MCWDWILIPYPKWGFLLILLFIFEGEPYLWARLDRKPTKQADKRLKKYQYSQKTCKGILVHMLFNLDFFKLFFLYNWTYINNIINMLTCYFMC